MSKQTCHYCGGKGYYEAIGERDCFYCAGTGRDTSSEFWALPCNHCDGRGREAYCIRKTCNTCHGLGLIDC